MRPIHSHSWRAGALGLLALTVLALVAPSPGWAIPPACDPEEPGCEEIDDYQKFPPVVDFLRHTLHRRAGGWVSNWREWDDFNDPDKTWGFDAYNPAYVHPKTFGVRFYYFCRNQVDWDYYANGLGDFASVHRYRLTVDGVVQKTAADCYLDNLKLEGQGIHEVKLDVFAPGQASPYHSYTQRVRVRDYLVVLLGDSAASGEGAPDRSRGADEEWGKWTDRRCHRSQQAAVPKFVNYLEDVDPYSTVTFLNFACSGATLQHWEEGDGGGILLPYAGIEPSVYVETQGELAYLPPQIDQLSNALLTIEGGYAIANARKVDMLFTTGGINDVRFAALAVTCVLLDDCHSEYTDLYDPGGEAVNVAFKELADKIPGGYVELADTIDSRGMDVGEVFVMQYPGAYQSDDGSQCKDMLDDVLPWWSVWNIVLNPLAVGLVGPGSLLAAFFSDAIGVNFFTTLLNALGSSLEWDDNEVDWMVTVGMKRLDDAVRKGVQDVQKAYPHRKWTFVDGIQAAFNKHGYCADDNWIQTAQQSTDEQGPMNFWSKPLNFPGSFYLPWEDLGLGINMQTKGLMHPNGKGYDAWADVLLPLADRLKNHAPQAKPETYVVNTAVTPVMFETPGLTSGVLWNDYDPNEDEIWAVLVAGPKHGTATLSKHGHLKYIPNPGFQGLDSVSYFVSDGSLNSKTVKATLVVDNPRDPRPFWTWNFPTGEQTTVVQVGGQADIPVCNKCGDTLVRIDPERLPVYGKVTLVLDREKDRWIMRYIQNGIIPRPLPHVETVQIEIGRMFLGVFQREGSAGVPVRIEGEAPPPPPAWAWTFENPERVPRPSPTRFDLCENCSDLEVRITVQPDWGNVVLDRNVETGQWFATYSYDFASDFLATGDGFGVEIGQLAGDVFTRLDATRVSISIFDPN